MTNIVIVGAARTAIGSFGGTLASVPAPILGSTAARAALERAGMDGDAVDEVFFGNVLQAGLGQNVARQVALGAGVPVAAPASTVNMVCGSGLMSVILAARAVRAGDAGIVLAGGTENMSAAPYVLDGARWGYRMGGGNLVDVMVRDGLWDAFNDCHMGITAENIAEKNGITREEQDAVALESQRRAVDAFVSGAFREEVVPVTVKQRKAEVVFDTDEYPRVDASAEGLANLRPAFKPDGTVTAGNASGINDAAAALVVMHAERARALGLTPMARIRGWAMAGVDPAVMGLGPVPATHKALAQAGLSIADLDLIEANEAFAAQYIAVGRELGFDPDRTNVNGGAIALGHPIGASGARILVTLLYALRARGKSLGLATLCVGGGQGVSVIIESL